MVKLFNYNIIKYLPMEKYSVLANEAQPLFLGLTIDQSGSTSQTSPDGKSKADMIADTANAAILELQAMSTKGQTIKDKIYLSAYTYGQGVHPALQGPISSVPAVREEVKTMHFDGVDLDAKTSIFIEANSAGTTPMSKAFEMICDNLDAAISPHMPAPVIINISDGIPNDMAITADMASRIIEKDTDDGHTLLMNVHIDHTGQQPILFPVSEDELPDDYAKFMFKISSEIPAAFIERTNAEDNNVGVIRAGAKAMIYNGNSTELLKMISLGTISAK